MDFITQLSFDFGLCFSHSVSFSSSVMDFKTALTQGSSIVSEPMSIHKAPMWITVTKSFHPLMKMIWPVVRALLSSSSLEKSWESQCLLSPSLLRCRLSGRPWMSLALWIWEMIFS